MSANTSQGAAARARALALEDMMNDLGLARAEEVAQDDARHRSVAVPMSQRPSSLQSSDEATNMWNNAIREGLFNDSDHNAVKQLDSIANGNLHRMNRETRIAGTRGVHNMINQLVQGDHRYDPTQLGYRGAKSQRTSGREIAIDPNFQVSSLGGLLPPGMTTKRWENTKKESMPPPPSVKQPQDASVLNLTKAQALLGDSSPKQSPAPSATLPTTKGPINPLLKENQPIQSPVPPREAAASTPVRKVRSTANRPLVSMPNRPVPTRHGDMSLPEKTQPVRTSIPAASPKPQPPKPRAEPIPNIAPVTNLKAKKTSSRPLVSMPACLVPQAWSEKQSPVPNSSGTPRDAPTFARPPVSQNSSPSKRVAVEGPPLPGVQSPVVGQSLHSVSAHPDQLLPDFAQAEGSLFESQVELQEITNGKKEVTLGQIVVGRPSSSDPVAIVTLEVEGTLVFKVTANTLLLPLYHSSTVFLRYQFPGQGEQAKQLEFSDSTTAKACFDAVDALCRGSQAETQATSSEVRLNMTATAFPKITSVPHVPDMAAIADKTGACNQDSSPTAKEIATDNAVLAAATATSQCANVAANIEMQMVLGDVAAIEAIAVDHNVLTPSAQASLAVANSLTDDDYAQIKESVRIVAETVLNRETDAVGGSFLEKTMTLKFVIMFLHRRDDFIALPLQEKKRALSIAYRKVL